MLANHDRQLSDEGPAPYRSGLLAVPALAAVLLAVSCVFQSGTELEALERELQPVVASSNAAGRLDEQPAVTGDALWDDYAQAVATRFAFVDEDDKALDAALVPDEILAAWEPEFGDDERYWELRYCLASCADFEQSADGRFLSPTDYLREAEKRGVAGANTLMLLHLERNYEYDQLINRHVRAPADLVFGFGDLAPPDHLPLRPQVDMEQLAATLELHARRDAEAQATLDQAVLAGPDEAWPRYLRAMHWLALGEYELGIADLKAGNQAQFINYPQPFPIDRAVMALSEPEPPGGAAVCGAVLLMAEGFPRREYTPVISLILDSLVVTGLSGDTEPLNAWHQFICRSPEGTNNGTTPYFVSLYLAQAIFDHWETAYGEDLAPEQQDTLQRARGAVNRARRPVRRRYREFYSIPFRDKLVKTLGDRGYYVAGYLGAEMECQINLELLRPVLINIAGISYPDLTSLESLSGYEPLSIADAQRRREAADREAEEREAASAETDESAES